MQLVSTIKVNLKKILSLQLVFFCFSTRIHTENRIERGAKIQVHRIMKIQ